MKRQRENLGRRIMAGCFILLGSMVGWMTLRTPERAFAQTKTAAKMGAPASGADAAAGKKVFAEQCDACHFANSAAKKVGPGLKGIYKRGKFATGKPVNDDAMRVWIQNGGKDMPAFKDNITAAELREVIAYLHTI
jgi:mono/diheme cytochrome c family protein